MVNKRSKSLLLGLSVISIVISSLACSLLSAGTKLKPQSIIDAFLEAGLEAEAVYEMKPDDYGLAPLADEGLRFLIPSICEYCGGRIMYYEDITYLNKAKNYYESLGKEMAALFSWVFVRDHILVQINGELPEEQARKYEQALISAKP